VAIRSQPDQTTAQQRAVLQIERCGRLQRLQFAQRALLRCAVETAQVVFDQRECARCADPLVRHAVHRLEGRTQALVTRHQLVQRTLQRCMVQRAGQLHAFGNVVRIARRIHLRQEPQPLLREGHRQFAAIAGHRLDRLTLTTQRAELRWRHLAQGFF
jgi:hypothetical protein